MRRNVTMYVGFGLLAVGIGMLLGQAFNESTQAAPSRVEAWQVQPPDDLRAELAGRALQGLLANQWLVDSVQAMIWDLHNGQPGLTDQQVDAWFKEYVAFHATAFADATLAILEGSIALAVEGEAFPPLSLLKD